MSAETEARQQEVAVMFDRHGPGYRWWAVVTVMHGLQPMQEGFFLIAFVYCLALIPAWMMTGRTQRPQSA